jgi:hypothetical protein
MVPFCEKYFRFFIVIAFAVVSCTSPQDNARKYIFLGHPYDWQDWYGIDPRLEQLDLLAYDQVWLGGDVCSRTTFQASTLDYLDSIFDLSSDRLQWTLGNHDIKYGNIHFITNKTKRPTFYTRTFDGICLLVLNTNLFRFFPARQLNGDCDERREQLQLIEAVTDTVSESSHLVILHHHAIMSDLRRDSTGQIPDVFNTNYPEVQASCDSAFYLTEFLYPRLQEVKKRGVEVVLVGGDLGMRSKSCEFRTPEDIVLLGSGINNSLEFETAPDYVTSFGKDSILIFHRDVKEQTLKWEFVELNGLVEEERK